jgi:hypothetical protein
MYCDITGKGLGFQKITGCMCMYVCVSMWECERQGVQQTAFQKICMQIEKYTAEKIQAV